MSTVLESRVSKRMRLPFQIACRRGSGNPNSIGFIRAYAERRLRRATPLALGPERLYLAQADMQIEWETAVMGF